MFDFRFVRGRAAGRAEQELGDARRQLRRQGVPLFPDGMLRQAVAAAPALGSGSFGTCYRVQVYADSRPLDAAAKVYHAHVNLQHALGEAITYQQLRDVPGVPRLLGVSLAPLCLVTTLHGPRTLLQAARRPSTPAATLLHALAQVAATLRTMHARRLCHNDLKFDNVLLDGTPDSPAATATLVDMGAVRASGTRPYQGRQLRGEKYPYLAPEVLRGGPVSPASDAFSLGWMLQGVLAVLPNSSRVAHGLSVARLCMHEDPEHRLSVTAAHEAIRSIFLNSPRGAGHDTP